MSDNGKAFLIGAALVFALLPFNNPDIGEGVLVFMDTAAFGVAGLAVGFLRPRGGWRLGLPLVAFWFLLGSGGVLLGLGEASWDAGPELQGLVVHVMAVVAACLGAEMGSLAGRRACQVSAKD